MTPSANQSNFCQVCTFIVTAVLAIAAVIALWQTAEIRFSDNLPALVIRSSGTKEEPYRLAITNYGKGPAIMRGISFSHNDITKEVLWPKEQNYFVPPGKHPGLDIPDLCLNEFAKEYEQRARSYTGNRDPLSPKFGFSDLFATRGGEFTNPINAYFSYSDVFVEGIYRQHFFYDPVKCMVSPGYFECLRKPGCWGWFVWKLEGSPGAAAGLIEAAEQMPIAGGKFPLPSGWAVVFTIIFCVLFVVVFCFAYRKKGTPPQGEDTIPEASPGDTPNLPGFWSKMYEQAGAEYRSEDRNTWQTFMIILVLNGTVAGIIKAGAPLQESPVLYIVGIIGALSGIAGALIICRSRAFMGTRLEAIKAMEDMIPAAYEKIKPYTRGPDERACRPFCERFSARTIMAGTMLLISLTWVLLLAYVWLSGRQA